MTNTDPTLPGKSVARYADTAMWEAEPIAEEGERVGPPTATLLYMTPDPLGSIAMANAMYTGHAVRDIREITDADRDHVLNDVPRTQLKAAFEFVDIHLLLDRVHRGITHQLVRQRTAVYVQESMRFAVKANAALEVADPPSIASRKDDDPARVLWDRLVADIGAGYNALIDAGIPAEDARGILPTNITTRVHWKTNLRNILDVAGVRLCTQAQFEWRVLWASILSTYHGASTLDLSEADGYHRVYRLDDLSKLFRPICFQTGKCEFMSSADRYCSIRERVNENAAMGRPSTDWESDYDDGRVFIGAIHPREWLADPAAARRTPAQVAEDEVPS